MMLGHVNKVLSLVCPHYLAQRLIDARIDLRRGSVDLPEHEGDWLGRHLAACAPCRETNESREALIKVLWGMRTVAPTGFAGRVLERAKRGEVLVEAPPRRFGVQLGFAGLAALLLAVFAATAVWMNRSPMSEGGEALLGGQGLSTAESVHFTVRAPGIGAAKIRTQVTSIVLANGGIYSDRYGAIIARIPRNALIGVTADLARQGRYKMIRSGAGEVEPSVETLVLRFELE